MHRNRAFARLLALFASGVLIGSTALAGPPLVCWKVETGGAASLPWTKSPRSYDGTSSDYDASRLVTDTLSLLRPTATVLARMETLRRAALYSTKNVQQGEQLLSALVARTKDGAGDPLTWFDAGYFVETLRQASAVHEPAFWTKALEALGLQETTAQKLGGATGYGWVLKAIEMRTSDPELEYAAALITWHPFQPAHEEHLLRAARGAQEGSLLAQNLLKNFTQRGRTLAALRSSAAGAHSSRE